jgi:hypothetical protein
MGEKAVIERFEGNLAVIALEKNEKQMNYPKNNLPKGAKEGDWLLIDIQGGKIAKIDIDFQSKDDVKRRIAKKLEKIRNKNNQ